MSERPSRVTHVYGATTKGEWTVERLIGVLTENFALQDVITVLSGPHHGISISVEVRSS